MPHNKCLFGRTSSTSIFTLFSNLFGFRAYSSPKENKKLGEVSHSTVVQPGKVHTALSGHVQAFHMLFRVMAEKSYSELEFFRLREWTLANNFQFQKDSHSHLSSNFFPTCALSMRKPSERISTFPALECLFERANATSLLVTDMIRFRCVRLSLFAVMDYFFRFWFVRWKEGKSKVENQQEYAHCRVTIVFDTKIVLIHLCSWQYCDIVLVSQVWRQ